MDIIHVTTDVANLNSECKLVFLVCLVLAHFRLHKSHLMLNNSLHQSSKFKFKHVSYHIIYPSLATISASRNRVYSVPSSSILLPPYSGNITLSPTATDIGICAPVEEFRAPGPTATTAPSRTLDCAFSGIKIPPFVFATASAFCTKTLSIKGTKFLTDRIAIVSLIFV